MDTLAVKKTKKKQLVEHGVLVYTEMFVTAKRIVMWHMRLKKGSEMYFVVLCNSLLLVVMHTISYACHLILIAQT